MLRSCAVALGLFCLSCEEGREPPCSSYLVRFDAPSHWVDGFQEAFRIWGEATDVWIPLTPTEEAATECFLSLNRVDTLPNNYLAHTAWLSVRGGRPSAVDFRVIENEEATPTLIMVHEVGHFFNLTHSGVPSVMSSSGPSMGFTNILPEDIERVRKVWLP